MKVFLSKHEVIATSLPENAREAFALSSSLGPSLAALPRDFPARWIAFSVGRFPEDSGPTEGVRFWTASSNESYATNVLAPSMAATLQTATDGLALKTSVITSDNPLSLLTGGATAAFDLQLPIPEVHECTPENLHWVGRFLNDIGRTKCPNIGITVVLRPAENTSPVFSKLREYFRQVRYGIPSLEKGSLQTPGEAIRLQGVEALEYFIRSGAWWTSVRAFGTTGIDARLAATFLIAALSGMGSSSLSGSGRRRTETQLMTAPDGTSFDSLVEPPKLYASWKTGATATGISLPGFRRKLREANLDLLFDETDYKKLLETENSSQHTTELDLFVDDLVIPFKNEFLTNGEQLSTLIQLPAQPNPAVMVRRGFGYIASPSPCDGVELGPFGQGGVVPPLGRTARIPLEDLTKHLLVVGATGSGKTTAVKKILYGLPTTTTVTILEGAKSEYRDGMKALNICKLFDFRDDYLPIHIFEHPSHVAPEEHISHLKTIFRAALGLDKSVAVIFEEALEDAYLRYHESADSFVKGLHPIRYWLVRSINALIPELGFVGDNLGTVKGLMRTRLFALSTGMAGKVLAGAGKDGFVSRVWNTLCDSSCLMELEGIADTHARSLIMSLFVMNLRYGLPDKHEGLRHVLVLEEAHRIIAKTSEHSSASGVEEFFGNLLSEIRSHGCAMIISDQSPSRLIDDAMRNTNSKLIMRLVSGADIQAATVGAGLPQTAASDIPVLRQGEAIYVSPNNLPSFIRVDASNLKLEEFTPRKCRLPNEDRLDREILRQAVLQTRNNMSFFEKLHSSEMMKTAFEFLGKLTGENPETVLKLARTAVGCTCLGDGKFGKCNPHREEPAVWAYHEFLRTKGHA